MLLRLNMTTLNKVHVLCEYFISVKGTWETGASVDSADSLI